MKLIRLTTENAEGEFDVNFKSEIELKENSKIALQNASINTNPDVFKVNQDHSIITFTIGGNVVEAELLSEEYDLQNYKDLYINITDELNSAIQIFSGKLLGIQFLAEIDTAGKTNISFRSSPYNLLNVVGGGGGIRGLVSNSAVGTFFRTNNTDSIIDDAMFYSTHSFVKGQGVFRVFLSRFNDTGADNGFIMGLSDVEPSSWGEPSLSNEQKTYSISITRTSDNGGVWNYSYKDTGGVMVNDSEDPSTLIEVGDCMELSRSNGKIRGKIYKRNNGATIDLFEVDVDNTTPLYPLTSYRSRGSALRVSNVRFQADPYENPITNIQQTNFMWYDRNITAPRPQPHLSVNSSLSFQSRTISEFLGYNLQNNNRSGVNHTYQADRRFTLSIFNDTLIIVLESMELESYDGYDGDRKNILAVIPVSDNNPSRIIQYEPNTLNFIELKNIKKQSIRGIKGRILLADLKKPSLLGLTTITLLID